MSNMITSKRLSVLLGLISMGLIACTSVSPQVTYYTLFDKDIMKVSAHRHDSLVLAVGPISIPDILKKTRIATGGANGRYQLSEYHRWAGNVDREFARALAEQLAAGLGTELVYVYPGNQHLGSTTCQVMIDVLAMDGELGKEARLSVRWSLIDPKERIAHVSRYSSFSEQPSGGGYDAWVKAQQLNIRQLGEEIAIVIDKRLGV